MKNAHLLLLFLIALMAVQSARAADIVALCIGNDAYIREEDVLDTPVADARLMKQALEALPGGADVMLLTDASRADIVIALNALKERARGAKLALVFYSGHGMDGQPRGYQNEDTFLLPVEAVIPSEDHLAVSAVGLREVLAALKDCPVTARAVILDCCRTGAPKATGALVAGGTKNFGQLDERVKVALGKAVVPEATLVAFAASPGRKAAAFLSEQDANSPFTRFLAEELGTGVGNLRDLVEAAAEQTELATESRQMPYVSYNGSINAIKQIVFRTNSSVITPVPMVPAAPSAPAKSLAERLRGATKDSPFVNSLGLEFVPVPGKEGVFMSRTEARVRDFRVYTEATDYIQTGRTHVLKFNKTDEGGYTVAWEKDEKASWEKPGFTQSEDHPVVCVSWEEARAMAAWLSKEEPGLTYRLPTDAEWSAAVGSVGRYPWGNAWPPPKGAGNYLGSEGVKNRPSSGAYDHDDGAEHTARIASYTANRFGFFDLGGNVYEWCEDEYRASMNDADVLETYPDFKNEKHTDETPSRVMRGGSWNDEAEITLRSSYRNLEHPSIRYGDIGFRLVVSVGVGG